MDRRSPGWAWLACALPLLISAGIYARSLDRYPLPYSDESFYPAPAISAVEGGPFAHPSRSDAPHGNRLWAYHGPLYPRLLVPVFRTFGITLAAARAPQFIAAYVAVFLLCGVLISRNHTWPAIILAISWFGDRTQQEILWGRMEGLCLLCLAVGFWGLLSRRRVGLVIAGAALAASCGFQPIALLFPVIGAIWAIAQGRGTFVRYAIGVSLAVLVLLPAVQFDPLGAVEQFRWHANLYAANQSPFREQVSRLFDVLHWSRYWVIAVSFVSLVLVIAEAIAIAKEKKLLSDNPTARLAALFAGCGLFGFVILARCAFPYNIVTMTVWPVIGLTLALQFATGRRRCFMIALAILLFAAWLPSAAWNLMRTREAITLRSQMDPKPAAEMIREAIPAGATVGVDGCVGLFGWRLERPVVLLPWHDEGHRLPADWWLLVTDLEYDVPHQIAAEEFQRRRVMLKTTLSSPGCPINRTLYLLGPRQ